jgi:predicted nucleic acid-binding protein
MIHPADAQVLALAQRDQFQAPVLTDDLDLRRRLEYLEVTVVGSVGVLVRAFTAGRLKRDELDSAVDALFLKSTLYISRAFRIYVLNMLANLK